MKTDARLASVTVYVGIATAVWLGWEVVKAPIAERAPTRIAVQVAPQSPEVLRRAAEVELGGGRDENAKALAEESLTRAPFNARALRVLGLAEARTGDIDKADSLLTLAGNWSLRDDPAHGWLIERRLRQGDYVSAFAHADTLARRWVDGNDRIYNLYTTAVLSDPRALPALAGAVARKPTWRYAFIHYLIDRPGGDAVLVALGLTLAKDQNGFSNEELGQIYQNWYVENRFGAIQALRTGLGRPRGMNALQNGDFSDLPDNVMLPFGWWLNTAPGISVSIIEDEVRPPDLALRVEHDGFSSGVVTEQILTLPSGAKVLTGQERLEGGSDLSRLRWRLACVETSQVLGERALAASGEPGSWGDFRLEFSVPSDRCTIQRLRLETDPGDRRATIVAWVDKMRISLVEPVR